MRATDFAKHLTQFLSVYLPVQKNASRNTVKAYRDTFKVLLQYRAKHHNIPAEKLTMSALSRNLIKDTSLFGLRLSDDVAFQQETGGLLQYTRFSAMFSMRSRQD